MATDAIGPSQAISCSEVVLQRRHMNSTYNHLRDGSRIVGRWGHLRGGLAAAAHYE
jgi:hypothetical protein